MACKLRPTSTCLLVLACTLSTVLLPAPVSAAAGLTNPPPFFTGGGPVPVRVTAETAPVVLDRSGSYVLAANADLQAGTLVVIAADDVTLDLAGFRLFNAELGAGASSDLVQLAAGVANVTLRNGSLVGGRRAVAGSPAGALRLEDLQIRGQESAIVLQSAGDIELVRTTIVADHNGLTTRNTNRLRLHKAQIQILCPERRVGSGILMWDPFLEVEIVESGIHVWTCSDGEGVSLREGRNVRIVASTIRAFLEDGFGAVLPAGARVTGSEIAGPDYALSTSSQSELRNNVFHGSVQAGADSLIIENRIFGFRNPALQTSARNRIEKNVIRGNGGDTLFVGSDNAVLGNILTSQAGCTEILSVAGSRNLLEDNLITGCRGIVFQGTASDNVYRDNLLVGAGTPVERFGTGTNNVDGGGNVCKGPCP